MANCSWRHSWRMGAFNREARLAAQALFRTAARAAARLCRRLGTHRPLHSVLAPTLGLRLHHRRRAGLQRRPGARLVAPGELLGHAGLEADRASPRHRVAAHRVLRLSHNLRGQRIPDRAGLGYSRGDPHCFGRGAGEPRLLRCRAHPRCLSPLPESSKSPCPHRCLSSSSACSWVSTTPSPRSWSRRCWAPNTELGWYLQWASGFSAYSNVYADLLLMAVLCAGLVKFVFAARDRLLYWQKGII